MYGDLGAVGGIPTFPALLDDVTKNNYDAVWHVGDFGYDLHSNGGKVCTSLTMSRFFLINFFEFPITNNSFIIGRRRLYEKN